MLAEEIVLLVSFAAIFSIIVVLMSMWGDRAATPPKKEVDPDEDHASDQGC